MKHSKIFWIAIIVSLTAGIIGIIQNRPIIYIPYLLINPALLFLLTSFKVLEPVKKKLEIILAITLFINAPGSIYLHSLPIQYDIPLHFFVGLLGYLAAFYILPLILRWGPSKISMIALVFLGGVAFEGFQKVVDAIFGSNLSSDLMQSNRLDVSIDILMDAIGAIVAAIFTKQASSQSEPTSPDRGE